jgi:uncharacterized protein YbjQ (UPF0145 family)
VYVVSLSVSLVCCASAYAQTQGQTEGGGRPIIPGRVSATSAESDAQSAAQQPSAPPKPLVHKTYGAPGFLVTTTSTLENYRIIEYKGVVEGAAVREPTWSQNAAVGAQEPYGGSLDAFAQMSEEARQQAFSTMVARAKEVGANGIIGIHFDSNTYQLDQGHVAHGVICVGTAVLVKPLR